MEANTPDSEDPKHISEPLRRVMDSLIEPFEGKVDSMDELSTDEMESRLSELKSKLEDGTASEPERRAIDDLTIALRAAETGLKSEDTDE